VTSSLKSQHQNRDIAMQALKSRLYQMELDKRNAAIMEAHENKGDAGWGNQIRSYVLQPYQMVKDLRTGVETSDTRACLTATSTPSWPPRWRWTWPGKAGPRRRPRSEPAFPLSRRAVPALGFGQARATAAQGKGGDAMTDQSEILVPPVPVVRRLTVADLTGALALGWRDFTAAPAFGLFFASVYVAGGWLIVWALTAKGQLWWTLPALGGLSDPRPLHRLRAL
jgi:hypothetical protein